MDFFLNQMEERSQSSVTILAPESLSFNFEGRQDTTQEIRRCFKILADFQVWKQKKKISQTDRNLVPIPICAGIPGIGKTRILEEWKRYKPSSMDSLTYVGVIVPYFNGHKRSPIDDHLAIESSFSWRLLHR